MPWSERQLSGGTFRDTQADATIEGAFYGADHRGAAGTFEHDSLPGEIRRRRPTPNATTADTERDGPPRHPASAADTGRDLRPYRPMPLRAIVSRGRDRGVRGERAAPGMASGVRGRWPWYLRPARAPASKSGSRKLAMSRAMHTAAAVHYPYCDGRPMAESEAQLVAMLYLLTALRRRFRDRPDVYVGGDMFLYYEQGNPEAVVAPDVFVVVGAPKREDRPRLSYKLWEEPKGPDFVLEVVSRSTRTADLRDKRALYASLGVAEYWLFDPAGEQLASRLRGMRLAGGAYRDLAPAARVPGGRTVHSAVLGLDVRVEPDGAVRLHDRAAGEDLLSYDEAHDARAAEAAARAAEAAARACAEARVAELEALVRELRGARVRGAGDT